MQLGNIIPEIMLREMAGYLVEYENQRRGGGAYITSGSHTPHSVLCLAFPDGSPKFKSDAQYAMVKHILNNNSSSLIILPTGGGKSLAWICKAFALDTKKFLIVIVPFKLLLADHQKTAEGHGLKTLIWRATDQVDIEEDVRIVFVTIETAVSVAFNQ